MNIQQWSRNSSNLSKSGVNWVLWWLKKLGKKVRGKKTGSRRISQPLLFLAEAKQTLREGGREGKRYLFFRQVDWRLDFTYFTLKRQMLPEPGSQSRNKNIGLSFGWKKGIRESQAKTEAKIRDILFFFIGNLVIGMKFIYNHRYAQREIKTSECVEEMKYAPLPCWGWWCCLACAPWTPGRSSWPPTRARSRRATAPAGRSQSHVCVDVTLMRSYVCLCMRLPQVIAFTNQLSFPSKFLFPYQSSHSRWHMKALLFLF